MTRGETVLLVEDDADNRTIYSVILHHHGYSVLQAGDGERGVQMARDHLPDLILMDLTIPRIDGLEATRLLKADPATSAIPIIALTAHAEHEARAAAAAAGASRSFPSRWRPTAWRWRSAAFSRWARRRREIAAGRISGVSYSHALRVNRGDGSRSSGSVNTMHAGGGGAWRGGSPPAHPAVPRRRDPRGRRPRPAGDGWFP